MQPQQPQSEHQWLDRLVGDWTAEGEASMKPGEPAMKWSATESVRSLGGLWVVCEARSKAAEGGESVSLMSLGYDPSRKMYVGTFIASMMTYLWIYEGSLDAGGRVLTLAARGPAMSGEGMADYHDVIEFLSDDERTLTSRVKGSDGAWTQIMTIRYRRKR